MRLATRRAAAVLGSGIAVAQAGHDDVVRVDPALKRLAGMITAGGEPDAEGRRYTVRGAPVGPPAGTPPAYPSGEGSPVPATPPRRAPSTRSAARRSGRRRARPRHTRRASCAGGG